MKILLFVNAAILLAFVKVFEIPSMIPLFVDELNITYAQAGIFMTAYTIIRCLASLPAGSITDRWGAVPVIWVCLLCVACVGLLGTLGNSYVFLLSSRIIVSIGIAIIFIAAVDSIPKYLPPDNVGRGIGYINGSLNLGIALALFLTPILADALGWRWTARLFSFSFLALALLSIPLLRNPPAILNSPGQGEQTVSLSIAELLKNPTVLLLALAAFIIFVELYGVLTWVPVFLAEVFHYKPAEVGSSATMFGIAAIPASIICGYLCSSLRKIIWLTTTGAVITGGSILILVFSNALALWQTICLITLITWGHTQVVVSIMSLASLIVPSHSSGKALGLVFTCAYAGSVLPTYLGGFLLESTGGYTVSFILFACAALLSIAAMLPVGQLLKNKPPRHFNLSIT